MKKKQIKIFHLYNSVVLTEWVNFEDFLVVRYNFLELFRKLKMNLAELSRYLGDLVIQFDKKRIGTLEERVAVIPLPLKMLCCEFAYVNRIEKKKHLGVQP